MCVLSKPHAISVSYDHMLCVLYKLISLQSTKRNIPMLFVRGDGVILISPPLRPGV